MDKCYNLIFLNGGGYHPPNNFVADCTKMQNKVTPGTELKKIISIGHSVAEISYVEVVQNQQLSLYFDCFLLSSGANMSANYVYITTYKFSDRREQVMLM